MSNQQIDLGFDIDALINKGKKRPKYKFEYLKDGVQAFRILPSFDPANRRIEHSYAVHWLTGENGKVVKVTCTYYTEKFCPICAAHKDTKAAYDHAYAASPQAQNTKDLAEALKKLSVSRSTFYNAVNASGEPCVLELNSTVSKALEALVIEAYQKKGLDATAVKGGVWFEFTKTGKGRDSVRVDFKRISKLVEGEMVDALDRTNFSDELVNRLPTAVANIHDPKVLYIKEYSSQDLADYLRGKPLPKQNPPATAAASAAAETEDDGGYDPGEAPTTQTTTYQAPAQQAPAPQQPLAAETPVNPSNPMSQGAPAGGNLAQYASHAERLKKLANPQG